MGIEVLAPDINASEGNFTIVEETDPDTGETEEKIRFGLYSIKNFGEGIADIIIAERTENGPFKSLEGFLDRVQDRNLNKKSLESLIKCGALDSFADRAKMLHSLDGLLEYNKQNRDTAEGQDSLFGLMEDESSIPSLTLEDCEPAGLRTILSWEKDLLGLYISGHPLDPVRDQLENRDQDIAFIKKNHERIPKAIIPGLIEEVKTIRTKKGDQMAFVKISDLTDSIEMVAFPDGFAEYKELLEPEQTVVVQAKISTRNDEISLILDRIRKLE